MLKILFIILALSSASFAGASQFKLLLPMSPIALEKYSLTCKKKVLKNLGWKIQESDQIDHVRMDSDLSCSVSATEFNQLTPLSLQVPMGLEHLNPQEFERAIDKSLQGNGSLCAYQQKYNVAVQRATKKLNDNFLYFFNSFLGGKGLARMDFLRKYNGQYWGRVQCENDGKCFLPKENKIAEALDELSHSLYSTDCGTGVQLAEYATLLELFGSQGVDSSFDSSEILVGAWADVAQSKSAIHGSTARVVNGQNGIRYSDVGYQSFIGVSGYIGSLLDEKYLDDEINRNENFIIVDSTQSAAEDLKKQGGLTGYTEYLRKVWELTQKISDKELYALQQLEVKHKLSYATEISVTQEMEFNPMQSGAQSASSQTMRVAKLLSVPFLQQTKIYVHPTGVKSITWHILRLARLNRRMPYGVFFNNEATHGEIFDRWLKSRLDHCED